MAGGDPRFEPIGEKDGFAIIPDQLKIDYLATAGELSHFYTELKENARLMGTRCPQCGSVYFWPRSWCHECYRDCEWVEVSQKGKITLFSEVKISLSDLQKDVPYIQGGVHLEGVRYPIVNFLRGFEFDKMYKGQPVKAEFLPREERTGRVRDFYFVPDD